MAGRSKKPPGGVVETMKEEAAVKKLLTLLLALALGAVLTACGGQGPDRNGPANGENNFVPPQDTAEPAAPGGEEPPEAAGTVWRSDDGTLTGALKDAAPGADLCLLITRSGEEEPLELMLPTLAKSVESVSFPQEDRAVVVSHVNPSLELYQLFDLENGEALEEYWGCGFLLYEDVLYYVQSPQQFSGVRGQDRILTSNGDLLYESGENRMIDAELSIDGGILTFYERDLEAGETVQRTCSVTDVLRSGDVSYY